MGIDDVIKGRREEILEIASSHGAHRLRVFGSVARGDARPDSDLDLLVVMEKGRTLLDLIGLGQDLEELLGRKVDVVSEVGLKLHIRDQVLPEAVTL
jgi:predicted nucleotidyltransferase